MAKTSLFVEYNGNKVEDKAIIAAVKKEWTEAGNKVGEIKTMDLYVKPEEAAVYRAVYPGAFVRGSESWHTGFPLQLKSHLFPQRIYRVFPQDPCPVHSGLSGHCRQNRSPYR